MTLKNIFEYICDNKEWLFSGVGIIIIIFFGKRIIHLFKTIKKCIKYIFRQRTVIVKFSSPIKGNIVSILLSEVIKAVVKEKRPIKKKTISISINSNFPETDDRHWIDLSKQLKNKFDDEIRDICSNSPSLHLSVFTLAPMPLIILLGSLFGDKINADVFQKTREPSTWCWQNNEKINDYNYSINNLSDGKNIALILSLTDDVSEKRITDVIAPNVIYKIKATINSVNCITSKQDLKVFWLKYQQVCNVILNNYGSDCTIHLFPVLPVSAAFEVGRRRMPGVYPKMIIYNENNGFKPTITIGE